MFCESRINPHIDAGGAVFPSCVHTGADVLGLPAPLGKKGGLNPANAPRPENGLTSESEILLGKNSLEVVYLVVDIRIEVGGVG